MANQSILVTGGAGYIGSHAVLALIEAGYRVTVVDDLSTGQRKFVSDQALFVEGDAGNTGLIKEVIHDNGIEAVVHFAGSIVVPESVTDPLKYYSNNVAVSCNLIESCVENSVKNFLFSSTAAVYGMPEEIPILERTPTVPINPYGSSKLMTEWILRDTAAAHSFQYAALRYFNVAGADPAGRTGQVSPVATHLIKIACQAAIGKRSHIDVYGEDYNTPDGTCIRDYIHVSDLASAHVDAVRYLFKSTDNLTANCGYGHGYSVREVLKAVEEEAGCSLDIRSAPRRPGDAETLVADATVINKKLSWKPQHNDLNFIVKTALDWERKL
jgi:UDP-glucose 4-epimerase